MLYKLSKCKLCQEVLTFPLYFWVKNKNIIAVCRACAKKLFMDGEKIVGIRGKRSGNDFLKRTSENATFEEEGSIYL